MDFAHESISCDVCNVSPIVGVRYKCVNCADFDLCQICESRSAHDPTHLFLKIKQPLPTVVQRVLIPYSLYNPTTSVAQSPMMLATPSLFQSTRSLAPPAKEKPQQFFSPKFPTLPFVNMFNSQASQSATSAPPAIVTSSSAVPSPLLKFIPSSLKGSGSIKGSGGASTYVKHKDLVKAANDFCFRLVKAAYDGVEADENLFVSPFAISSCLMLAANGAVGETYLEIVRALGYGNGDLQMLNYAIKNYSTTLNNDEADIYLASSMWTTNDLEFKMPYAQTLTEFYNTHPYTPIHSPTAGAWAAEQTHGKIFSLPLPDDDIQIYFKGIWRKMFEPYQEGDFDSGRVRCKYMKNHGDFQYFEEPNGLKAVSLPYRGHTRAVVILPPESVSPASCIN